MKPDFQFGWDDLNGNHFEYKVVKLTNIEALFRRILSQIKRILKNTEKGTMLYKKLLDLQSNIEAEYHE